MPVGGLPFTSTGSHSKNHVWIRKIARGSSGTNAALISINTPARCADRYDALVADPLSHARRLAAWLNGGAAPRGGGAARDDRRLVDVSERNVARAAALASRGAMGAARNASKFDDHFLFEAASTAEINYSSNDVECRDLLSLAEECHSA